MVSETATFRAPLYSPIPVETIQDAVLSANLSDALVPTTVDVLDELQLSLSQKSECIPNSVRERAAQSSYLFVDEYMGTPQDPYSQLIFLTGEIAQTYLKESIPDNLGTLEEIAVRAALKQYPTHPGINYVYEPEITPLVSRVVSFDDLVMVEPGPFYPPTSATIDRGMNSHEFAR